LTCFANYPSCPPAQSRRRQSAQEKIQKHLNNLRQDNLSVADFLLLLQRSGRQEWRNCVRKLRTAQYTDVLASLLDDDPAHALEKLQWGMPIFEKEIAQLCIRGKAFGQWTDGNIRDLNQHLDLRNADYIKEAEKLSPHLFYLLKRLLTQHETKLEQKETHV
jgi:hypothetical protein